MFKFILVLGLMVTTLLPSAISSKELHNEVNVGVLTKDLISEKVQSMQVTRVKQEFNYKVITDFSGSEYILTELEGQGYLIFLE